MEFMHLTDATAYIVGLLGEPNGAERPDVARLASRAKVDPERLSRALRSLPETVTEDTVLRARLFSYATDVGLSGDHALAVLEAESAPLDTVAFRGLVASVAVPAAPRLSNEAVRQRFLADVTLAIACASLDGEPQRIFLAAPSAS